VRHILSEFGRYLGVGALSYALSVSLSALQHEVLGVPQNVAVAVSLAVVLVTNFVLARVWIFRAAGNASGQFARFVIAAAVMRGFEYVMFLVLAEFAYYLVALTGSLVVSSALKFVVYRRLVFGVRLNGPVRSETHTHNEDVAASE
jgi:putative flippase GtrA